MKWYFATNNKSPHLFPLIKGAVLSAVKNTTLKPCFIYDGKEDEFTKWLKKYNVEIIYHRVSFYEKLKSHFDEKGLITASGAFLRCDIPMLEKEEDFVLYTDCDVLFLKDSLMTFNPDYFACAPESHKTDYKNFNTGVMVMNIKKLKEDNEDFISFICNNLDKLKTFDQAAFQIFYKNKLTRLPLEYNHKPYWGKNKNAVIAHFHGSKPTDYTSEESLKYMPYSSFCLYKKNPQAYDFYLDLFKSYYPEIEYCTASIEKLKTKIYPVCKKSKKSLLEKIKNRLKIIKNSVF